MPKKVLLVDDDPSIHAGLLRLIKAMGCEAITAATGAEAIARIKSQAFDLCITDLQLADGDGRGVVREARAVRPPVSVVALTAHGTVSDAVDALRIGASDVLGKPFHITALEQLVARLLASEPSRTGQARPTPGVAVIGDHPAMRLVLDRVDQIADTDASVLIRGETGTGKEVVARLLHGASQRRAGPFVAVNVSAIPEPLAESELFGHVRGAFTGADKSRTGRFAAADGGTLFLDEIGEMPRGLQVKLLRALQEREVTPVGGSEAVAVDVRVVAATHRDLEGMIEEGTFREDLFYRLDVVPIEIPPLRERRQDIPALADHFRVDVNAREGRTVPGFALDVIQRLGAYDWPGNVRELENLVERLVVVAGHRMVVMDDLPSHLRMSVIDLENATLDLPQSGVDLRIFLTQLEERLIAQALERTGGNKNRAAELLGMNRTTLVEKLRRRNVA
ncbi:MAG TPA: sigma-54 dependent transcriptional regulator [Polyangia bacterium]|jgi:DNA-binding NtrC family response regulator|nr:sigma-54 dependent transcriptional regulator [Polyangia bacterium]